MAVGYFTKFMGSMAHQFTVTKVEMVMNATLQDRFKDEVECTRL